MNALRFAVALYILVGQLAVLAFYVRAEFFGDWQHEHGSWAAIRADLLAWFRAVALHQFAWPFVLWRALAGSTRRGDG